jgi:predicted PurR-regulated permease PerM
MFPHSLQSLTLGLISTIAIGFLLIIGKTFLIPIALAILFSFLLYPVTGWLERHGISRILANFIALLCTIIIIAGVTIGLSFLTKSFIDDLPALRDNMTTNIEQSYEWVEDTFAISTEKQRLWIQENLRFESIISDGNLRSIFNTTTTSFLTIGLMFIYTFFFLYYRDKFKDFLFKLAPNSKHDRFHKVTGELTTITPHYLIGLVIVVLILAVLNSVGFAIIGINNPIFFGVIAAVLNIIPYIGTVIGFGLVFLVTLATQDVSTALWILPVFLVIQFFENNVLTPNITAGQVDLNPLVAIIGVTIGGAMWGVIGMLIVIPILGMFKILCENVPRLHPVAYLLGSTGTEEYALSINNIKKKWQQWFSK